MGQFHVADPGQFLTADDNFNQQRHLISRQAYKTNRSVALEEWQSLVL